MAETDVHGPTAVSLLWDALRRLLQRVGQAFGQQGVADALAVPCRTPDAAHLPARAKRSLKALEPVGLA